jgi:hypothetical protein
MDVSEFLSRLEKVKANGPDKWVARCPSHEDKSPSLSIKLEPDGRVLCHCFAGCPTDDVLGAVGYSMTDLFPPNTDWTGHGETGHFKVTAGFTAMDALLCLNYEASIVLLSACDLAEGKILSPHELTRLTTATGRIATALTVVI